MTGTSSGVLTKNELVSSFLAPILKALSTAGSFLLKTLLATIPLQYLIIFAVTMLIVAVWWFWYNFLR